MTTPLAQIVRLASVEHRGGLLVNSGEMIGGYTVARFSDGMDCVFETTLPGGFGDPLVTDLGHRGPRYKVTIERLEEES